MQPYKTHTALFAALLVLFLLPGFARADAAQARKYIADAKACIESRSWDDAENKLKFADSELDGVADADKQAITKEIEDTRKQLLAAHREYDRPGFIQGVKGDIEDARSNVTVSGRVEQIEERFEGRLQSDDGKFLLTPEEIAAYRKEFATIKKVAMKDRASTEFKRIAPLIDELEQKFPEALKKVDNDNSAQRMYAVRDIQGDIDRLSRDVSALPQDDEKTKAFTARLKKMSDQLDSMAGASEYKEYLARLQDSWKSFGEETAGWQDEKQIPTAEQVTKTSSQEMSAFMAPKTIAMIRNGDRWLEMTEQADEYKQFKDKPEVKSFVEKVRADRNAAMAKMEQVSEKIVADVEKLAMTDTRELYQVDSVANSVEHNIPGSPKAKGLVDRLKGMRQNVEKNAEAAQAAKDALAKKLCDAADAGWPKIAEGIKADEVSDPEALAKGQTIKIFGHENRMGSDFRGEGYDWGVAINGHPIVGICAPNVRDAAKAGWDKIRGTNYNYSSSSDVIAVVEGRGKVGQRVKSEVRDSGGSRLGDVTRYDQVDCMIVKIIALHEGPIAVGPGGAVSESGAIAPVVAAGNTASAGVAGSSGSGWAVTFLWSLVGLAGAAAVFLRARPEAAAQAVGPQGTAAITAVNHNLDYIGLVLGSIGIAWLLMGFIVKDFLPAGALTLCGIYTASGFLRDHGILKEPLYSQLRPLGVPIALASAVIMVLHLFLGSYWLF